MIRTETPAHAATTPAALVAHLDRPLPDTLVVGRGNLLYLTGRCYHPTSSLASLAILVDDVPHPVANHSLVRPDVPADDPAIGDQLPNSLTSGFWALLPFPASCERPVHLTWRAVLVDGRVCSAPLGILRLLAGTVGPSPSPPTAAEARVAICMTTYNPEPQYFAEQVASIVAQRHRNWTCIVCDDASAPDRLRTILEIAERDPRFRVVQNATRLGYYGNFERCLAQIPSDATFVALADQDDVWYPEKLASALARFRPETTLVYGDMDIVSRERVPIAPTYWTTRRNNFTDLAAMVFANTVTGAASVFRAALLPDLLPFPPRIGEAYHDHWIACVALTAGELGYVDRPLHAYRQHEGNVLGHFAPPAERLLPSAQDLARALTRPELGRRVMAELWRWRDVYTQDVLRLIVIARLLLLRLGERTTASKRRILARVAALEDAPVGLVRETLASVWERRPTLGAEWRCLRGTLAAKVLDRHYRRHRQRLFDERVVRREVTGASTGASPTAGVELILEKLAPLRLRVSRDERRRINVLTPAIDVRHLFAGYLGKLHLALRLSDVGHAVRLVIVDRSDHDPTAWRRAIAGYPGLEGLFDRVEVAYAADRSVELAVHPRDAFIASTWWTAHLAHRAVRDLEGRRFVYLIQEYEPMTFPMGSLYALAAESYTFPHVALFSTELLRDYFRAERTGVFAADVPAPTTVLTFRNAIATFDVTPESLARRGSRRLLFYARPEQHAARNMFELGVLALRRAVADGLLDPESWRVEGIGAGRAFEAVPLGGGVRLALLPRVDLAEYHTMLPGYDVGLALMLTPHPSLVPLEMAAAGQLTVTNTFANKTAAALAALSSNLIAVPPTVTGIRDGLAAAIAAVDDLAGRAAGSKVAWSTRWSDSFDDRLLAALADALADS